MRHAAAFLAAALAASTAQAWPSWRSIEGNGRKTTQRREVPGSFDAISTRGSIDARVRVGPAESVAVTIDENLQEYVNVRLEGSTLVIDQRESLSFRGDGHVDVTLPTLRAASTSGSSDMAIDGSSGGDLDLATSGSGDIRWRGEARRLEVSTSGSGDAYLSGRAERLDASTSGSGDLEGADLTVAGDVEVSTSGSGDVEIAMAGGSLRASTSGSGDVVYRGEARAVHALASGSGEVRRR
jgi:hypothetical protein